MALPIYKATIESLEDGIINISLVDDPAVGVDFITLSKDDKIQIFKSVNEDKHLLTGVIMTANQLIYRRNGDYEYYIKYEPETIRIMAEKLLSDMAHENIDIDHKQNLLDPGKVLLQELWIKTPDKPGPFENIEDGSLLATYHVYDEEIWEMCKSDRFNGFSLCGYFGVEQEKYSSKKTMLDKIKTALKSILVEAGSVTAEDGTVIYYDGETLEIGLEVVDENGSLIEDGEYTVEDKVIVVEAGKIAEIKDKETEPAEETPADAPAEEETLEDEETPETPENPSHDDEPGNEETPAEAPEDNIESLKAEISGLKTTVDSLIAEIEAIKTKIVEIETKPAVPAIEEEYEQTPSKENRWTKIGSMLR